MNRSDISLIIGIILGALVAPLASTDARAETYHSDKYGYSIDIPRGWVRIPDGEIRVAKRELSTRSVSATAYFDLAFQQSRKEWFRHPFVTVYVIERPSRRPFDEYMLHWIADDAGEWSKSDFYTHLTYPERETLRSATIVEKSFDTDYKTFRYHAIIELGNGQRLRLYTFGFFGPRRAVVISGHSRSTADADLAAFQSIERSFRFDAGTGFEPPPKKSAPSRHGRTWALIVLGAVVLLVILIFRPR